MEVISRAEIGLIPATRSAPFGAVTTMTGHYYGGDLKITKEADIFAIARNIQYNDMFSKGYSDIMYNFGANPFRPVPLVQRGLNNRNAANGNAVGNETSVSVLMPFGPDLTWVKQIPNWESNIIASCRIIDDICEQHFHRALAWTPHKYWRPTGCPGDWMTKLIAENFDEVAPPPFVPWMPDPDFTKRPVVGFKKYGGVVEWDGFVDFGYVRWVQMFLNRTSPEGCAQDGVWGRQSDDRLRKFQGYFAQQGFPCHSNGITDRDTWATIHWIATVEGIV